MRRLFDVIAVLIVVLGADDQPIRRNILRATTMSPLTEDGIIACIEPAVLIDTHQLVKRAKITIVPILLAREQCMHDVVKIVTPLTIQPIATTIGGR